MSIGRQTQSCFDPQNPCYSPFAKGFAFDKAPVVNQL